LLDAPFPNEKPEANSSGDIRLPICDKGFWNEDDADGGPLSDELYGSR